MSKPSIEGGLTAIAVSGLQAQKKRIQILAENIANANSVAKTPGGEPYRRQVPMFKVEPMGDDKGVALSGVKGDPKPFPQHYDPGHPAANTAGYVQLPNVNSLAESLDLKQAMRAYEANLNVLDTQGAMEKSTLSLLDGK
uniref:flagellar basal body rod protein FlgC n=1 Tax=uncultured Caulobacter sp. TaxID=158749 RepID=UPI0025CED31F|nr:flagellar basal body rod protein FlgC [uncultured Caulobacter sp.]